MNTISMFESKPIKHYRFADMKKTEATFSELNKTIKVILFLKEVEEDGIGPNNLKANITSFIYPVDLNQPDTYKLEEDYISPVCYVKYDEDLQELAVNVNVDDTGFSDFIHHVMFLYKNEVEANIQEKGLYLVYEPEELNWWHHDMYKTDIYHKLNEKMLPDIESMVINFGKDCIEEYQKAHHLLP